MATCRAPPPPARRQPDRHVAAATTMTIRRTRPRTSSGTARRCHSRERVSRNRSWMGLALLLLAGCGSEALDELPRAAGRRARPPSPRLDGGRTLAILSPRKRELEPLRRAHAPPHSACAGRRRSHPRRLPEGTWCYVIDTPRRRAARVPQTPRLWSSSAATTCRVARTGSRSTSVVAVYVTLPGRNELVQLPAHGRPHVLRRWPTVRQPDLVAVDQASGRVRVTGESASGSYGPDRPATADARRAPR